MGYDDNGETGGDLSPSRLWGSDGSHWYDKAMDPLGWAGKSMGAAATTPTNQNNINYSKIYDPQTANIQGQLAGRNPFAGQEWSGVISQLQNRANGVGGLAAQEYNNAAMNQSASFAGAAHGGASPAAFRQAAIQQGQIGQGMANGSALAQTQEQMAAQQQLQGALGTRDQINSNAYNNLMGNQGQLNQQDLQSNIANQQNEQANNALTMQRKQQVINAIGSIAGGAAKMGG